ncbi:hypothetical protein GCM10023115_24600 [Pontixanthobacter gangjinensis]|uniref:VOC family protein n=1 Tax=Christiangramia aestuarii TaxID=1028746 RepID=A0A7K1LSX2_9FLAO|nr:VOC family protein [Christiangramia aestuarii]MUP43915.1 VOC family protein [Christiangramia aestuarii]
MTDKADYIEIEFLDHVAIRVSNIEISTNWYKNVLGLKKYKLPEWGDFPVFMLANKSGVAIFPANTNDKKIDSNSRNVKIDHFAFNVNKENFEKAEKRYKQLNLNYKIENHYYFKSIYTKDPDNHTVELTTILVDENKFYK